MKQRVCVAKMAVFLVGCIVCGSLLSAIARANEAPLGANGADAATPLVQQMAGTWDVRQRMWPGAAAKAIDLPPAVAHRVLIGNAILQEVMTVASESSETRFTRVAYFDYNTVNQQYEYFSLDTRAPQWGESQNVPFRYRLVVERVKEERQAVRLYLTPQSGVNIKEFLAFECVYTRRS